MGELHWDLNTFKPQMTDTVSIISIDPYGTDNVSRGII